jgi:hypothetical protein
MPVNGYQFRSLILAIGERKRFVFRLFVLLN